MCPSVLVMYSVDSMWANETGSRDKCIQRYSSKRVTDRMTLSLTETTFLLLTYVLSLGVNAVDHTVAPIPSNNTL